MGASGLDSPGPSSSIAKTTLRGWRRTRSVTFPPFLAGASDSTAFPNRFRSTCLDLRRIDEERRITARKIERNFNQGVFCLRRNERDDSVAERPRAARLEGRRARARKVEKVGDQRREPLDLVVDDADGLEHFVARGPVRRQSHVRETTGEGGRRSAGCGFRGRAPPRASPRRQSFSMLPRLFLPREAPGRHVLADRGKGPLHLNVDTACT